MALPVNWQGVETLAQEILQDTLGSAFSVAVTGGSNSTQTDLLISSVTESVHTSYVEVKKVPSIAGIQCVITLTENGYKPSSGSKFSKGGELCQILDAMRAAGRTKPLESELEACRSLLIAEYHLRGISALFFYDSKTKKPGLISVDQIASTFDVRLETRHKLSGSGHWPRKMDEHLGAFKELHGLTGHFERRANKVFYTHDGEIPLSDDWERNKTGYGLPVFEGFKPQLSIEATPGEYTLRKRSYTKNLTVLLSLSAAKSNPGIPDSATTAKILGF